MPVDGRGCAAPPSSATAGGALSARRAGRLEAHHVTPLHRGGAPYDLDNLETLCRSCHIERHRRKLSPGEAAWKRLVAELLC